MNVVEPNQITTLLLDPSYMPFGVATARAAFYSLLKHKGVGITPSGQTFNWDQYIDGNYVVPEDNPVMRSGFNAAYSSNTWNIPTIFLVNDKFFFKRKKKMECTSLPSVREVWEYYDGICCFCHEKVKFKDASREHIHSVALGGSDHEDNIALAHTWCNAKAGHAMPKKDIFGNEIEAEIKIKPAHFMLSRSVRRRPEWQPYLFEDIIDAKS
jgi:hypothetical protein